MNAPFPNAPFPLALLIAGLHSAAIAQGNPVTIPVPTHDWGCEVILCLANPAGPTAVAPCVPPIRRLWSELARGHAFPSCAMAAGPAVRSYAVPTSSYYGPCPSGTRDLPEGQLAELVAPMRVTSAPPTQSGVPSPFIAGGSGLTYAGIGSGDGYGQPSTDSTPPAKVCVAREQGTRDVVSGDLSITIHRFDVIFVSPARPTPQAIDVYIDNAFWQRVRW